ncbi:VOC family protein [Pseudonocardia spinosispora]|uniref:VOC family protein n=1 Tax=Pseudonocardia spinosispora TaxID=103441 RepID=UPI000427B119|nr:VOC family protein [Pseudonocardia spinosispora]
MLDHVSITVDDLEAAVRFYDAVMGVLGHDRVHLTDKAAGYGTRNSAADDGHCYLSVVAVSARAADDRHWAFRARSRPEVDQFHAAALAHGGRDDQGVGERREYHDSYYAAFVLDPAGNRIEAVTHR